MEVNNRNYIISHINSSATLRRDIYPERHLVEEGCNFKWQIFFNIEVLIKKKNLIFSKYEPERRPITGNILFPIKIHPPRPGRTLFAYHDENHLTIFTEKNLFLLSHFIP